MGKLHSNDVFKPGAFPEYTYVSRVSPELKYSYELRLKQALNRQGYLTSIIGASKTGKTVLCEKVIGLDKQVSVSGSYFKNAQDDFWLIVAREAGMAVEGEHLEMNEVNNPANLERKSVSTKQKYMSNKDKVIDYFKENQLVLIIDDFHYAKEDLQLDIAHQLKDAIRKEFKAIIISLPHRADDAIRKNPDLLGRLSLINIEPWKPEELREIATVGFKKLEIDISDEMALKIAVESLSSPQLMQTLCLDIAFSLNLDEDRDIKEITDVKKMQESYRFTTANLPYQEVVKKLQEGPSTRGQKRKTYELIDGKHLDVYSTLLRAMAEDPPTISIPLDEIKNRIDNLMSNSNEKLDKNKIKEALRKLQDIMITSDAIYQVFEWKDNKVYVLDPLFLFFLRWGVY
ncbi:TPA: ATP-binding protein [Bacillus cereus biovar anthracis]|uniref:hypothetical protein n=1 Tax=Bacillus anthracis TaxID=1392 RepID=UPI0001DBFB6D|nr:hypothetical protein [Bacillus cereus]ADK07997.1 hypothetical protein BACI_c54520 [Bacillus cereus biovar anthracis str. CI]HDR4491875.1 ATP-binding protein [Bacillus cereus biovar anthracis]